MCGKKLNCLAGVIVYLFSVLFLILLLQGCVTQDGIDTKNPVPTITAISPNAKVSHYPSFTLTIEGKGFIENSVILFNGVQKQTEYVSATRLTCTINPADITVVAPTATSDGLALPAQDQNMPVAVRNPSPGGGGSYPMTFTVRSNPVFSTPIPLTSGNVSYYFPSLVVQDTGNVCLAYVYADAINHVSAIDFIRSDANGTNWGTPVRIAQAPVGCYYPKIALDNEGNINIVFFAVDRLYFARSTTNGTTWSTPVALSSVSDKNFEPAFAIDSAGGLNVIWPQWVDTVNSHILFSRSTDKGVNWSVPINIYAGWLNSIEPSSPVIAVDSSGGIFTAWADLWWHHMYTESSLKSNYSLNNGLTWQNEDDDWGGGSHSSIAVHSDGVIYKTGAAVMMPHFYEIFCHKSEDRFTSWKNTADLPKKSKGYSPQLKIDRAGNLNVIYVIQSLCYFFRSQDGGATWTDEILITDDHAHSWSDFAMSLDQWGNIYMAYVYGDPTQIYFISSK